MRLAILASGNGSNFEAIARAAQRGDIAAEIVVLFCDRKYAKVLQRAQAFAIPTVQFSISDFSSKKAYECALRDLLVDYKVDWVILAGYMRIISTLCLQAFPNRIVNIHPSLLPSFPGLHGIKEAYDYGVKVTGITIHYVDQGVDTGPIIHQVPLAIEETDSLADLDEKIHQLEHRYYPQIIAELVRRSR